MAASEVPKAAAQAKSRAFQRRCQARRSKMIITAPPSTRSNATPSGEMSSNRFTATATPTYCDTAPIM